MNIQDFDVEPQPRVSMCVWCHRHTFEDNIIERHYTWCKRKVIL